MYKLLDIQRKDFGSIEHRKAIAELYDFNEQEVLDLPKKEFKTLVIGLIKGEIQGKVIASAEIKGSFFCVPIDIWNHREEEFKKIIADEIKEMKEKAEGEADEQENTGTE